MVWYGMALYRLVRYGMVCYVTECYGMVWYGMVRYCMVWYDGNKALGTWDIWVSKLMHNAPTCSSLLALYNNAHIAPWTLHCLRLVKSAEYRVESGEWRVQCGVLVYIAEYIVQCTVESAECIL